MDLTAYLRVFSKRLKIIVALMTIGTIVAATYSLMVTPTYRATAKLFVGQRQITLAELSQASTVTPLSSQLLSSYAAVLKTRPVAEKAVEDEKLPISPSALIATLRAEPVRDTQLIELSYDDSSPAIAQRTVNAM